MRKKLYVGIAMFLALMSVAHADDLQVGESTTVEGMVHFEKRYTFVPYNLCVTMKPCSQSKPYWSAILQTQAGKYEIDQVFNEGDGRTPLSVELQGVNVRSGSILKLDATVEYVTQDYFILGKVHDVHIVMDYAEPDMILSYPNWSCHGNLDRSTEIQISVWYKGTPNVAPENRYGLRLNGIEDGVDGQRTYSLATLNSVEAAADRDDLIYRGQGRSSSVELVVPGAANLPDRDNLTSRLTFNLGQSPSGDRKIPLQSQLQVVCNRIR